MNPFFFEIVRGQSDRYSWQLVTYLGGKRDVIARSSRDWGSFRKARRAAKATKDAACSARVVPAPPRPGDIRFEVVKDVLALNVTGFGDPDGNGHHRVAAARTAAAPAGALSTAAYQSPAAVTPPADTPRTGDGAAKVDATDGKSKAAPDGESRADVSDGPQAGGEAQPAASPRQHAASPGEPAMKTEAAATGS